MVEMRLMQAEKYHLVRYSWLGQEWDPSHQPTVITFQIQDLGASRNRTGEGLLLEVSHDGWQDSSERERQERIWRLAMPALEALLNKRKFRPWWEGAEEEGAFRQVKIQGLKPFVENLERIPGPNSRKTAQALWKCCSALDSIGTWYLQENEKAFELRYNGQALFAINDEGTLSLFWDEFRKLLGASLEDFADRLSVEQDLEVHTDSNPESFRARSLSLELWTQWFKDAIHIAQTLQ